jgi:hypothetical protein
MQCSCGAGTRDKTSNKLDKERGVRVIIEWSECTSCGRTLVTDRREEKPSTLDKLDQMHEESMAIARARCSS